MTENEPAGTGLHRLLFHATALVNRRDGGTQDHGLGRVGDGTPDAARVGLCVHGKVAGRREHCEAEQCDAEKAKRRGPAADESGTHCR